MLIDKPVGPTSHDVVSIVRRALGNARVGHAGTLDPPASGLLVILAGKATRLARFATALSKRYAGTVRFGAETTTDDAAGEPTVTGPVPPEGMDAEAFTRRVREAVATVAARTSQTPPPVSAKKLAGERAYRMVRRGETPEMKAVPVTIHRLEGDWARGWGGDTDLAITVECSSGTYVRALARDIGRAAGCPAHLAALRRTGIGPWDVGEAVPPDAELADRIPAVWRPMREAVAHLPSVALPPSEATRFTHGQKLACGAADGTVTVFEGNALIGIGEVADGVLRPDVVLVP